MKCDVLNDLLTLMHVTLGKRNVLLSFQIELRSIGITSSDTFYSTTVCFDVNHITHTDFLFLKSVVYRRIEFQFLHSFRRLQSDNNMRHGLTVSSELILRFLGCKFRDFTFVDFLVLLDSQTDRSSKVFHKNLRFLYFRGVHLGTDHRTERYFRTQFLCNSKCKCSLSCTRCTRKK